MKGLGIFHVYGDGLDLAAFAPLEAGALLLLVDLSDLNLHMESVQFSHT